MPHVIVEYAVVEGEVLPSALSNVLDELHLTITNTGLFNPDHIKVRLIPLKHFRQGGEQQGFIHTQIRIRPGRSSEQKSLLSQSVLNTLARQAWLVKTITVEVVEMDGDSYAKLNC